MVDVVVVVVLVINSILFGVGFFVGVLVIVVFVNDGVILVVADEADVAGQHLQNLFGLDIIILSLYS